MHFQPQPDMNTSGYQEHRGLGALKLDSKLRDEVRKNANACIIGMVEILIWDYTLKSMNMSRLFKHLKKMLISWTDLLNFACQYLLKNHAWYTISRFRWSTDYDCHHKSSFLLGPCFALLVFCSDTKRASEWVFPSFSFSSFASFDIGSNSHAFLDLTHTLAAPSKKSVLGSFAIKLHLQHLKVNSN